jgi:hypothetical protein
MGHGLGPGGRGKEGFVMRFRSRYIRIAAAIVARIMIHKAMFVFVVKCECV